MPRFLVDIPDDDLARIDAIARAEGRSRASVLREAVTNYIAESSKDWLEAGFGLWAKYGFAEDGLNYQNRLRDEWAREWEPAPEAATGEADEGTEDAAA